MIQKKKFVKTFRNTKTVQLVLLLLLEAAYVLVLTLHPALGTQLFENRTLLSYAHSPGSLLYLIWYGYYMISINCAPSQKKVLR